MRALLFLIFGFLLLWDNCLASPVPEDPMVDPGSISNNNDDDDSNDDDMMMSSQNGPFIQGQAPGAPMGYQSLPAMVNPVNPGYSRQGPYINVGNAQTLPATVDRRPNRQGPFINVGNAQTLPAMVNPRNYGNRMPWSPRYQQPQPYNNMPAMTNAGPSQPFDGYGSVAESDTGVQEVDNTNEPWNRNNNMNYNPWSPRYQVQPYMPSWSQPQPRSSMSQEQVQEVPSISGWTTSSPMWRRSYTPLPGQSNCFNRCRPSCRYGNYCKPVCRARCNIRPTCGRQPPLWQGNTMVCGLNRPSYYRQAPGGSWGWSQPLRTASLQSTNNNNEGDNANEN